MSTFGLISLEVQLVSTKDKRALAASRIEVVIMDQALRKAHPDTLSLLPWVPRVEQSVGGTVSALLFTSLLHCLSLPVQALSILIVMMQSVVFEGMGIWHLTE